MNYENVTKIKFSHNITEGEFLHTGSEPLDITKSKDDTKLVSESSKICVPIESDTNVQQAKLVSESTKNAASTRKTEHVKTKY